MPPSPHAHDHDLVDLNDETMETHRSRKRRKQVTVFEDSGLTKEIRRETRMEQRTLNERLKSATAPDQLGALALRNNELFKAKVKYSREAVLDAENVHLHAQKMEQYVESLVQVPRYDAGKLIYRFKQKCSTDGRFNWLMLGKEAGVCFNALPERVTFLSGPLAAEPVIKERKAPKQRSKKQDADLTEAVKPQEIQQGEQQGDPNKLSATEKTIKQMEKQLKKRIKENQKSGLGNDIDGVKYLCNPCSFTQTVENIFHFSFLIKKGEAKICLREEAAGLGGVRKRGGIYVTASSAAKTNEEACPHKQSVLTLTMRDWRAICDGLTEGDLPHRQMM
ncbi:hypothetical protein MPSEU_000694000 [Mayamaea pseudoterrestris]|nr:hypothetical protein MPSEU_000694000 [Mayamaea pseudoterrestris]